jgi:Baseplate J-like protein
MIRAASGRGITEVPADVMAANPIFVESEEDLPGVIQRVKLASTDDVPLVLPVRARFGQSRFNFQLLREFASRLGKRVTIVSSDPAIQQMAHENGLATMAEVQQGDAAQVPRSQGTAAPHGWDEGEPTLIPRTSPPAPYQPPAPAPAPGAPLGWSIEGDPVRTIDPAAGARHPVPPPPTAAPQMVPPPGGARSTRLVQAPGPAPRPGIEPGPPQRFAPAPNRVGHGPPPRTAKRGLPNKMRLSVPTYLAPPDVKPARVVFYGAAALVLLVGIIASVVYMPSAEVDMVAKAKPFSTTFSVSGDPGRQPIPLRVATASRTTTQSFNAGRKVTQAQASKGTVAFNAASCPVGFQIPSGTRMRGPGGVQFATTGGDVSVGGSGNPAQAPAAIVATQPGPAGNVGAGPFVFENPNGADCISIVGGPTTGGADQQQKTEILKSDLDNAQNQLDQGLKQQIKADLSKGTRRDEKLLTDQIQWKPAFTTPGHQVGDGVTSFTGTLVENATAYYYRPTDLNRAIVDSLQRNVPNGEQIAGSLTTNYQVTVAQNGHLTFSGKANGFVAPRLDSEVIKSQVSGRSPSQVKESLKSRYPVQDVQVKQYPFGLPFMPLSTSRVTVRYQILSGGASGRSP